MPVSGLQTARQFALSPTALLEVAGVHRSSDLRAHHVREVPELAVRHLADVVEGDVSVLGNLLETALEEGCVLWLTHVDEERRAALAELFGPDLVHVVGTPHDGLVPVAVNPTALVEAWAHDEARRPFLRESLDGLDAIRLPGRVVRALDAAGVRFVRHGRLERAIRNPVVIAYAVVLVYSALRALPVSFVREFHGNLAVLWAIDLATAIPYTWGVLAMVTARGIGRRLAGTLVTVVTFVAPYVYFWAHGRHYPPYVVVVVVALVASGIAIEGWKISRDRQINRRLAAPPDHGSSATG